MTGRCSTGPQRVRRPGHDLDRAVDTLDEVACKYICLLTGKGYSNLKATVQFDWKKVFRVPLQKPPA